MHDYTGQAQCEPGPESTATTVREGASMVREGATVSPARGRCDGPVGIGRAMMLMKRGGTMMMIEAALAANLLKASV
jgi:hypothetical protein